MGGSLTPSLRTSHCLGVKTLAGEETQMVRRTDVRRGPSAAMSATLKRKTLRALLLPFQVQQAAIVWLGGLLPMFRVPHGWTLEGSRLKVVDARDRFCWDRQFPPLNRIYDDWAQDKVVVADIDGDGRTEVLVNYLPEPAATGGSLMCFEQNGKLRWQVRYGGSKT